MSARECDARRGGGVAGVGGGRCQRSKTRKAETAVHSRTKSCRDGVPAGLTHTRRRRTAPTTPPHARPPARELARAHSRLPHARASASAHRAHVFASLQKWRSCRTGRRAPQRFTTYSRSAPSGRWRPRSWAPSAAPPPNGCARRRRGFGHRDARQRAARCASAPRAPPPPRHARTLHPLRRVPHALRARVAVLCVRHPQVDVRYNTPSEGVSYSKGFWRECTWATFPGESKCNHISPSKAYAWERTCQARAHTRTCCYQRAHPKTAVARACTHLMRFFRTRLASLRPRPSTSCSSLPS